MMLFDDEDELFLGSVVKPDPSLMNIPAHKPGSGPKAVTHSNDSYGVEDPAAFNSEWAGPALSALHSHRSTAPGAEQSSSDKGARSPGCNNLQPQPAAVERSTNEEKQQQQQQEASSARENDGTTEADEADGGIAYVPCRHNNWDNVRVKKQFATLCCRDCAAKLKLEHPIARKCPDFYESNCVFGVHCPLFHIHRYKNKARCPDRPEQGGSRERWTDLTEVISGALLAQPPGTPPHCVMPSVMQLATGSMKQEIYRVAKASNLLHMLGRDVDELVKDGGDSGWEKMMEQYAPKRSNIDDLPNFVGSSTDTGVSQFTPLKTPVTTPQVWSQQQQARPPATSTMYKAQVPIDSPATLRTPLPHGGAHTGSMLTGYATFQPPVAPGMESPLNKAMLGVAPRQSLMPTPPSCAFGSNPAGAWTQPQLGHQQHQQTAAQMQYSAAAGGVHQHQPITAATPEAQISSYGVPPRTLPRANRPAAAAPAPMPPTGPHGFVTGPHAAHHQYVTSSASPLNSTDPHGWKGPGQDGGNPQQYSSNPNPLSMSSQLSHSQLSHSSGWSHTPSTSSRSRSRGSSSYLESPGSAALQPPSAASTHYHHQPYSQQEEIIDRRQIIPEWDQDGGGYDQHAGGGYTTGFVADSRYPAQAGVPAQHPGSQVHSHHNSPQHQHGYPTLPPPHQGQAAVPNQQVYGQNEVAGYTGGYQERAHFC